MVLGVATLGIGAMEMLAPRSPAELQEQRNQQQVQDLVDSQERVQERIRQDGESLLDALQEEKVRPGEHRPPIRIRIP